MDRERLARQRREDALDEVLLLVDLAINRSRVSRFSEPRLKGLIRGTLEAARQQLLHLRNGDELPDLPVEYGARWQADSGESADGAEEEKELAAGS